MACEVFSYTCATSSWLFLYRYSYIHAFTRAGLLNCLGNSISSVSPLNFFPQSSGDISSICQYSDFSFKCFKKHTFWERVLAGHLEGLFMLSALPLLAL